MFNALFLLSCVILVFGQIGTSLIASTTPVQKVSEVKEAQEAKNQPALAPATEAKVEIKKEEVVPGKEEKKDEAKEQPAVTPATGAKAEIKKEEVVPAKEEKKEEAKEQPAQAPATEAKPAEKPLEEISAEEIEGIDTVDIETPQGNWLLKRLWWERAKKKFNKIRLAVNQIADTPMKFITQQSELEKSTLDPFYREMGLEQGELQEVIKTLIDKINQERAKEGTLEFEQREALKSLVDEQKNLEQLNNDVTAVNALDSKLDEALTLLLKQVNQARVYENQAWETFDAIAHELSDQKAQELYYNMDALLTDIEKINTYIQKDFTEYFQKMVDKSVQQINDIKKMIEQLKKKGIDLKEQQEKLSQPSDKQKMADQKAAEKKQPAKEEKRGWFGSFWNWIKCFFSSFWR